jgi:hypothetical protein
VRLRPLLAHRWPLCAAGCALIVLGSLIAWAMWLQSGAVLTHGPRLAAGPTRTVAGSITQVLSPRVIAGQSREFVHYRFTWSTPGQDLQLIGMCFVPTGQFRLGDPADIDVLEADPDVHCIAGGMLRAERDWLYPQFWFVAVILPGAVILLGWLAGLFQLRHVLVHGDVSVGRVLGVESVRFVLPEMLRVVYEFRDHRAETRRNRHWVRKHGALGSRLRQRSHRELDARLPVLHDRRLPQWNRLLLADDFLRSPVPAPEVRELT